MPGEKRASQILLRKDVFPTAESPTNTILKSRSGVEGVFSSCGQKTVHWALPLAPAARLPFIVTAVVHGDPSTREATSAPECS